MSPDEKQTARPLGAREVDAALARAAVDAARRAAEDDATVHGTAEARNRLELGIEALRAVEAFTEHIGIPPVHDPPIWQIEAHHDALVEAVVHLDQAVVAAAARFVATPGSARAARMLGLATLARDALHVFRDEVCRPVENEDSPDETPIPEDPPADAGPGEAKPRPPADPARGVEHPLEPSRPTAPSAPGRALPPFAYAACPHCAGPVDVSRAARARAIDVLVAVSSALQERGATGSVAALTGVIETLRDAHDDDDATKPLWPVHALRRAAIAASSRAERT